MGKVINWPLLSHPMNWIIVLLMVLIGGAGAHLLAQYYQGVSAAETAKS